MVHSLRSVYNTVFSCHPCVFDSIYSAAWSLFNTANEISLSELFRFTNKFKGLITTSLFKKLISCELNDRLITSTMQKTATSKTIIFMFILINFIKLWCIKRVHNTKANQQLNLLFCLRRSEASFIFSSVNKSMNKCHERKDDLGKHVPSKR